MTILTIRSGKSFPSWTFAHYIYALERNYRKLTIINSIITLIEEGAEDRNFKVAFDSIEVFQDTPISIENFDRYANFISKSDDYIEFWRLIGNLNRPAVFHRPPGGEDWQRVYKPEGPEGFRILQAQLDSPFIIKIEGVAETINNLRFAKEREKKAAEAHEMDMQERVVQIRAQEIAVGKEELNLLERRLALQDRLAATNIDWNAQREIVRRLMLVITNQAEKNTMIDAAISEDDEFET